MATDATGALDRVSSLPYLPGELQRTADALREVGVNVRIPDDVQHLVDTASFNAREPDLDDAFGELELIAAGTKLRDADDVVVPFHHDHGQDRILGRETTQLQLSTVTERDELAEHYTRHIERPTVDCFIVSVDGPSKWMWRGRPEAALHSRDPNVMRAVLALTFPLSPGAVGERTGVEEIAGFDLDDEAEMRRRGPMQRNLIPVRLRDGAVYDDVLGVRFR
jgi:hypothetical protein